MVPADERVIGVVVGTALELRGGEGAWAGMGGEMLTISSRPAQSLQAAVGTQVPSQGVVSSQGRTRHSSVQSAVKRQDGSVHDDGH